MLLKSIKGILASVKPKERLLKEKGPQLSLYLRKWLFQATVFLDSLTPEEVEAVKNSAKQMTRIMRIPEASCSKHHLRKTNRCRSQT